MVLLDIRDLNLRMKKKKKSVSKDFFFKVMSDT